MMVDTFHGKTSVLCTRDDLIRLVVGMQWREMVTGMATVSVLEGFDADGGTAAPWVSVPEHVAAAYPTAVDIVDEWLGVR